MSNPKSIGVKITKKNVIDIYLYNIKWLETFLKEHQLIKILDLVIKNVNL